MHDCRRIDFPKHEASIRGSVHEKAVVVVSSLFSQTPFYPMECVKRDKRGVHFYSPGFCFCFSKVSLMFFYRNIIRQQSLSSALHHVLSTSYS